MKEVDMCVSIIVPVYNVELYLRECVESLINQTYENLEVILVDDGSTDMSGKICDEYAEKDFRVKVYHIENAGPSVARNYGLKKASGNYIMFVDSDDWIQTETLRKCYESIQLYDSDMVVFNLCNVDEKDIVETFLFDGELRNFQQEEMEYLENAILTYSSGKEGDTTAITGPCCKLMKKKILDKCFFPKELTIGEDTCFVLQFLQNTKKVTYISDALYFRRVLRTSLSHSCNVKSIDERRKFVNWIIDFYKGKKSDDILSQFLFHHYEVVIGYLANIDNMKLREKRREIKRFLKEIDFEHDFKKIKIKHKNKNVRLVKKLLQGKHETLVLVLYKLVEIKKKLAQENVN